MKYMRRKDRESDEDDEDPLTGVANLFDVAMVFALGLMVMVLLYLSMPEVLTQSDVTIIKNPGQQNMEVIVKQGERIEKLDMKNETVQTEIVGEIGKIYKTESGGMIFVPTNLTEGVP
jgi:hypothetical protein